MGRKVFKLLLLIGLISLLFSGCAGRNFVRPEPESFSLGSTTQQEIINRFGKPYREGTLMKNDVVMKTVAYAYASTGGTAAFAGVIPARSLGFYFLNDTLVGHEFTSSYKEDSTYFDETALDGIKKGVTNRSQVTATFGNRYGEYIHPLIVDKDKRAIVYLYHQTKGSAYNLSFYEKQLIFTFDENGVLTDTNFTASGQK